MAGSAADSLPGDALREVAAAELARRVAPGYGTPAPGAPPAPRLGEGEGAAAPPSPPPGVCGLADPGAGHPPRRGLRRYRDPAAQGERRASGDDTKGIARTIRSAVIAAAS